MKRLFQITLQPKIAFKYFLLFLLSVNAYAFSDLNKNAFENESIGDLSEYAKSTTTSFRFETLDEMSIDPIEELKANALKQANLGNADEAIHFISEYISATADLSILNDHLFEKISENKNYINFKELYTPDFSEVGLLYIYAGLLGIFIFIVLNIKKNTNKVNNFLISLFVLFHSVFILHLGIYVINCQYYLPNALFISTPFSFIYGPLLYFYFKRVTFKYKFKLVDIVHLIPTICLIVYILPFYFKSSLEKFDIIFDQANFLLPGANVIIVVKILSLLIYAHLSYNIYANNKEKLIAESSSKFLWQRNIIFISIIYVISYVLYAGGIANLYKIDLLFHVQIIAMVTIVFYIAYMSYAQPEIFRGEVKLLNPTNLFNKYKNSGLTSNHSIELKDQLLELLNNEKVYKQNDLNFGTLALKLGTTRHNTSQVINEHFDLNFFELINKYRINEAKEILKNDTNNNLNIIQVAYEVGFNNKVTFNKSFKKQLDQTPTQFIKSLRFS